MKADLYVYWPSQYSDISEETQIALFDYKDENWIDTSVSDLKRDYKERKISVVVPHTLIFHKVLQLSKGQAKYINDTLPYLLEPFLANDIEKTLFSYKRLYNFFPKTEDNSFVYLCSHYKKELITHIIDATKDLNIQEIISSASFFYELASHTPSEEFQSFIEDSSSIILTRSTEAPFICQYSRQAKRHFLDEKKIDKNYFISHENQKLSINKESDDLYKELETSLFTYDKDHPFTSPLFVPVSEESKIDLSGNIKNKKESIELRALAKRTFFLAIAATSFILLFNFGFGVHIDGKAEKISNKNTNFYKTHFPKDKKIIDIKKQIEGKLRKHNLNPTHKESLTQVLNTLSNSWKSNSEKQQIKSIQFSLSTQSIYIELTYPSIDGVEKLNQDLSKTYNSRIQSVTENTDSITARIKIDI